jgi:hypothetical protein
MAIDTIRDIAKRVELIKIKNFYNGNDIYNYLIKWNKEDSEKFEWRKKVSYFKNFTKPIVNGLVNRLFIKQHVFNISNEDYLHDIDLQGDSLKAFIKKATMLSIRDGLCLIYAGTNNKFTNISKLDEEKFNIRGYLKIFEYNQIVNYRYSNNILTQIVLQEQIFINDDKDDYNTVEVTKYIRLFINGGEVYIKNGNKIELIDSWSNDLNYIPITIFYGTLDYSNLNANSIIKDIVELNNSHYNLSSGLMNISHIVSNPIPIIYGQPQNLDRDLKLGVNSVIMFPTAQNNAYKFEWVEVLGNGVKIAEREIDKLEEYIISISFDILRVDKINTATEAIIKDNNNKSILSTIADNLESSINKALSILENLTNTKIGNIEINKDIDNIKLNSETIKNLIELRKNNIISNQTILDTLIKGEIIDNIDINDELAKIQRDMQLGI